MKLERKRLGDVCDFVRGPFGGSLKKDIFKKIGYAVYEQQHAIYDQFDEIRYYIDEDKFNEMKRFELAPDDLIMSCSGTMGKIAIVPKNIKKGIINQALLKLTPSDKLSGNYLKLWMQSSIFQESLKEHSQGATIQNVASVAILKKIEINLPSLPDQKRIVEILNQAESLLTQRQQSIDLLNEFLKSTFVEMFGDPVRNEKGWVKQKLKDICLIRRGASPRPINAFIGGQVPWIKIGDGTKGNELYITETKVHITEEGAQKSVKLNKGALIFANCGVSLGFARILAIDGCIHDGWLSFSDLDKNINQLFLLKLINHITVHLRSLAPGGTQPNLNSSIMGNFEIIIPPIELQIKFATIAEKIETIKIQYQQSLTELQNMYGVLSQKAFKGELNVKEAKIKEKV